MKKLHLKDLKEIIDSVDHYSWTSVSLFWGLVFQVLQLVYIKKTMQEADYAMTYFYIGDLEHQPYKMMTKEDYESYFHVTGSFKNRFVRMIKHSMGTKGAFDKMCSLVRGMEFVNLEEADKRVEWEKADVVEL